SQFHSSSPFLTCCTLGKMEIRENIPLAPLTTFKVGGPARFFIEARSEEDVRQALDYAHGQKLPAFVLGGGSNLVISDDGWPGLVIHIALAGITHAEANGKALFRVGAGEDWDGFVSRAVESGCGGIECLSGIPGTAGGTPVQNVGAYGQEVSETITQVRVLEIATGRKLTMSNADCGFTYRTSVFNTTHRDRYIVLEVAYRLNRNGAPRVAYADLKKFFAAGSTSPTLEQVRDAVRSVRQSKAMLIVEGDEDCRSAGSFFKNPVVNEADAKRIEALAQKRAP